MNTSQELASINEKVARKQGEPWARRHADAWAQRVPLAQMICAVGEYIDQHQTRYDSPVSKDGVLGDEGIKPMLQAINTLLNGELNGLDGGTLSTMVCHLIAKAGYKEGEV